MAAATVHMLESDRRLGLAALITDIQTWLTANVTGTVINVLFVGDIWFAVLEIPAVAA